MSHREHHLGEAVRNCIAFEDHSSKSGDGCPHCLTKHAQAIRQFLSEECEQGGKGAVCSLIPKAEGLLTDLPLAYNKNDSINESKMAELQGVARQIRLAVMQEMGVPGHKHRQQRGVEHVTSN